MKKIFALLAVIACVGFGAQAFALESLLVAETGGGRFGGTSQFFDVGTADGVTNETQQKSSYNGAGSFPSVLVYQNTTGGLYREESISGTGLVSAFSKTGNGVLATFMDQDNPEITHAVLQENAVGVRVNFLGSGAFHTITSTSGGLVMQAEVNGMFTSATLQFGMFGRTTTGYGPTDGGEGERFSAVTQQAEDHYRFGAFTAGKLPGIPIGVQYSASFNGSVSLIPVIVP